MDVYTDCNRILSSFPYWKNKFVFLEHPNTRFDEF